MQGNAGKCISCNQTLATHHEMTNPVIFADGNMQPAQYHVTAFCDNFYCPSKQPVKHDGKLDEAGYYCVDSSGIGMVLSVCDDVAIELDAKQALSLLDWLRQEKETLEQMAKEQKT